MKKFILATLTVFAFQANAYEMGLTGGMQSTKFKADTAGSDVDGVAGYYAGILGFIEAGDDSYFRTGVFLSQRKFESDLGANSTLEGTLTSLDIPLTYMFMFSEYAGVYGGLKLGLNMSDDCSISNSAATCDADAESLYYAADVGGHFRFVPNFGLEVDFNMGLSDIAKDVKLETALAVGLFYLF